MKKTVSMSLEYIALLHKVKQMVALFWKSIRKSIPNSRVHDGKDMLFLFSREKMKSTCFLVSSSRKTWKYFWKIFNSVTLKARVHDLPDVEAVCRRLPHLMILVCHTVREKNEKKHEVLYWGGRMETFSLFCMCS